VPARDNRAPSAMPARLRLPLVTFAVIAAALGFVPGSPARAEWLAPLTVETAETIPSGTLDVALGASYFHNRRFPAFTGEGFIHWQDLVTGPEVALRAAAGDMVEIQASYELIDNHESTIDGVNNNYSSGDARLFAKIYVSAERKWLPAMGVRFGAQLPNANRSDRLGTDTTDFFIWWLGSKHIGAFTVHCNLGLALLDNPSGDGQDDLFTYAIGMAAPPLALDRAGDWTLRFLLEEAGVTGSHPGASTPPGGRFNNDGNAVRGGAQLTYGGLTFYAGASGGLNSAAEQYGFMGGVIYAFEVSRLTALFD
jgi:hypothetical protein